MSSEWQPIETAPKDGTPILAAWQTLFAKHGWFIHPVMFSYATFPDGIWVHAWDKDEDFPLTPTHWMPLPAPPVAE